MTIPKNGRELRAWCDLKKVSLQEVAEAIGISYGSLFRRTGKLKLTAREEAKLRDFAERVDGGDDDDVREKANLRPVDFLVQEIEKLRREGLV